MRLLRAPLLHFLAIGAALFGLQRWLSAEPDAGRVLVVPATEVERLALVARGETGHPPSSDELAARVDAWVDEELLVREARDRGWHRSDPVVRMRLVRDMQFVAEGPETDPDDLLEQAYALGLDRSDLVARRRLAERMRLDITAPAAETQPSEKELRALLRRDAEALRRPALVQLTQVFLARDRRGASLEHDARDLRDALVRDSVTPEQGALRGDPFLVPAKLPLSSERALAARLGPDFAHAALEAPVGRWSGPLPSAYGLHLVWVHRRIDARDATLEEVRPQLVGRWRAERERELLRTALARLRSETDVRLESEGGLDPTPGG